MSPIAKTTTTDKYPPHADASSSSDISDTPPVTAEGKVLDALRENPGTTTAILAKSAGVGRSTASKILARWASEGTVIRTAGKDQRAPVTWTNHEATETDENTDSSDIDTTTGDGGKEVPCTDGAPEAGNTVAITEANPVDSVASGAEDATPSGARPSESKATTDRDDGASPEQDTALDGHNVTTSVAQSPSDDADGHQGAKSSPEDTPAATAAPRKNRLAKGGLYELVKSYLAEHPGDCFGPAKIGSDLGRSGGAVSNALDKLVTDGHAVRTCEAPKRFTYQTDITDAG